MSEATRAEARSSQAKKENVSSQKQKKDLSQSISSTAEQILFLQRTIGNLAVGRLIKSRALQAKLNMGHTGDIHKPEANCSVH